MKKRLRKLERRVKALERSAPVTPDDPHIPTVPVHPLALWKESVGDYATPNPSDEYETWNKRSYL